MTQQLTTQNATITTATIQIQTLTIGRKQVTLAVFRQLLEEDLLDPVNAAITGVSWGRVNYHPDKCGDAPEHLHVVWQKGDELRRATVLAPHAGFHTHPAADLYVRGRLIRGTAHRPWVDPKPGDTLRMGEPCPGGWRYFHSGRFAYDGMNFEGSIPASLREAWRDREGATAEDREAFEEDAYCLGITVTNLDQVEKELLSMLPTAEYRESWAALSGLPQLFIAV